MNPIKVTNTWYCYLVEITNNDLSRRSVTQISYRHNAYQAHFFLLKVWQKYKNSTVYHKWENYDLIYMYIPIYKKKVNLSSDLYAKMQVERNQK